ncbi:MAG: FAD-dependent oxidoreductase [Candidatus Sericytochromatia bacterium]|nr:FAD-dependent oxidoreductase [Candidatus Sericytochromatia bacterium]
MRDSNKNLKIAVIGGGISGIMSAHLLQKEHDVTIFEASTYLGGHSHSVKIDNGIDQSFYLDTAFLIFNNLSYPNFIKFIKELDVYNHVESSEMSFAFSDYDKDLFFGIGKGFSDIFYQKKNLYNPRFYKIFFELIKFRKNAYSDMVNNRLNNITLGEYLSDYSELFKENMIAPTAISVWSLPNENIWDFPAETYIRFQKNHNYLKGFGWINSKWYTFNGASIKYINAFLAKFKGKVNLNSPVKKVKRFDQYVEVFTQDGISQKFDKVIFATHADTTLKLIDDPSKLEISLLGKWKYNKSIAILHTDSSLIHHDKKLHASWNIKIKDKKSTVTYYLNNIQNLKTKIDYFITLDSNIDIKDDLVLDKYEYSHPIYDINSIKTQRELKNLNGYLNSYFCGSYFGYGFHEDAVLSAKKVALKFGIE